MTPILYEKDEIDFTSQGLGSLVEIYDVDVEEQRNGLLQLTASYPVSGLRYADISVGRIILAKPNQRDDVHAFRIVSTELDISGYAVTIEADSITYDLTHNVVKHLVASGNGQAFMTALKNAIVNPSIFAFYSDITTSSTTSLDYVNPMEAIMGTTGSFLQIWGGEIKRENRRVAMFNRRGRDNVATFRLGKNISGLKYSVDISSLVTRIIPTKSVQNDDQTTTMLEGTPVDSQYINNYEQIYTLPLEFTDDTIKTVADLNAAAKGWFTKSANTGRDKPTVTIDIDVLSLQDSADYHDKFKNLESVSLTDTVTVYVPEYGVNVTAIVNELHYDPILDRVTKMTVGTAKQSFADSSRTQLSDLQDKIISVQNQADAVAVSANGKSTNYYGSVEPSHPQKGDAWFWVNGDKSGVKVFVNGEWVDLVDSDTQGKIEASVTKAVSQAKSHTATAIEQNNASQQKVMNDIAKSQADLAIKDGNFNNKAQAMADKALADAKANTATVAQETLNSANQNIAAAKSDLTDGLQKEVSDRTSAVTALDTKAQGYVSAAKTDVLKTVNKEVIDRQNAVTALDTKAQGYVSAAKTDALNTIAREVTDRQNAVSALDTKATNAVNQAKSDINDTINALSVGGRNLLLNSKILSWGVGSTNTATTSTKVAYDATTNMWHITSPKGSSGNAGIYFSQTNNVSDIITKGQQWAFSFDIKGTGVYSQFGIEGSSPFNKLSGNVPTDWTRVSSTGTAAGTDTKSVIIYFNSIDVALDVYIKLPKLESGNKATDWTPAPEDIVLDYTTKDNQIKETITQYKDANDGKVTKAQTDATTALGLVATKVSQTDYDTKTGDLTTKYTQVKQTTDSQATDIVDIKKTATSQASKINSISSDVDGTKQSISDIKKTQDSQSDKVNQITNDVNGTKQSITDIQTKDGKQDTRMGTIETSVSGVKSDFSSYKITNNGSVKTAQNTAQQAVDGLTLKVSKTDYNQKTGDLSSQINDVKDTADKSSQTIADIQEADGKRDSKISEVEKTAGEIKSTVSDLSKAQGEQSGYISKLQQRADGFDATVTKVNDLSVGGRNLLINTSNAQSGYPIKFANTSIVSGTTQKITFPSVGETCIKKSAPGETYYRFNVPTSGDMVNIVAGKSYTFSADIMGNVPY
uniref:phage tail spike protein n=1 Tax=Leuconostoc mesenteroides TaxID=1245 RepID=UPI00235FF90E